MTATSIASSEVIFVGQSSGARTKLRRILAEHHGVPPSHVRFVECGDWEADTVIRARALHASGAVETWHTMLDWITADDLDQLTT